jgi:hypothetical protein
MSVFNQTYESLMADGYIELDNMETTFAYMRQLYANGVFFKVSYRYDWWNNQDAWLIEIGVTA